MKQQLKLRFGRLATPLAVVALKVHTRLTGTERARIIVRNEQGEILLVRGIIGLDWSLPGGGMNRGEEPITAALRELFEETGIYADRQQTKYLMTVPRNASPVGYTAHLFEVSVPRGALPARQHNTHEILELAWYPVDALPDELSPIVSIGLQALSTR